jgi:MFS transporter, SP family, sugar:H+ symporter
LATLWQLAITTGIVLVSILNIWLAEWSDGWRISYGGNVVFALVLVGMLRIMPESPRFLIAKGKTEEAREALAKVRFEDQLDWEAENIECEVKEEVARGIATWPEIFSVDNKMKYRVLMGMGLQTIQQLSGINAIMVRLNHFLLPWHTVITVHTHYALFFFLQFYAPTILERFFGSKGGIYGAMALNVINFFSTFITIATVERVGRVKLLFSGAIVMCLSLISNAILSGIEQTDAVGYLVVFFCATYVIGYDQSRACFICNRFVVTNRLFVPVALPTRGVLLYGVRACNIFRGAFLLHHVFLTLSSYISIISQRTTVVCAETFPLRERGKATGLTTFTNWFWTTIVGAIFPAASAASLSACFGFFAGVVFVAVFVVYLYLPETANRSITEIDEEYKNHKSEFPRKKWM